MTDNTPGSTGTLRRPIGERLRADSYLTRLDWHLEAVMPGKQRRAIVKELRQTLNSDPRDMTASLRDLGSPKELAEQYAGDGQRRPLWSIGVIAAAAALLVYWTIFLSFTLGMLAAVESIGAEEAKASFLTIGVTAFSTVEGVGFGWVGGWAWLIVPTIIAAIAFLLGARLWRAIRSESQTA
jgi:hypothetical protein